MREVPHVLGKTPWRREERDLEEKHGHETDSSLDGRGHPEGHHLAPVRAQLPNPHQSVCRNVQRFRGGLVFKAHILLYHSTLGLRAMKKQKNQFADARGSLHGRGHPEGYHLAPVRAHLPRDWYFIAEQPAPAPHPARPEGRAALTLMLSCQPPMNQCAQYRGTSLNRPPPPRRTLQ